LRASVVICTHNRATVLKDALTAVARLEPPAGGAEVIVVDNASSDATPEVVSAAASAMHLPYRAVREETLGLSAARNRAVAEAKGEVVAFLDDDAVCETGWLVGLLAVYDAHPDAECVGGRVRLNWVDPPPPWWSPAMDHHLSAVDYGDEVVRLRYPTYPYGANISYHRRVFDRGLTFDPRLGRRGTSLGAGEELALGLAIEAAGGAVYYTPHAEVWHRAERARTEPAHLFRKSYQHGASAALLEFHHFGAGSCLATTAKFAAQAVLRLASPRRSVERGCEWRFRLGYMGEALRLSFSPGPAPAPGP
jgi:glycosyltransferase involved in cell wall biosynthesis